MGLVAILTFILIFVILIFIVPFLGIIAVSQNSKGWYIKNFFIASAIAGGASLLILGVVAALLG